MSNEELLKFVREAEADIATILQDVIVKAKTLGFHLDSVEVGTIDVTTITSSEREVQVSQVDIQLVREVELEIPERVIKAQKMKSLMSLEEMVNA